MYLSAVLCLLVCKMRSAQEMARNSSGSSKVLQEETIWMKSIWNLSALIGFL